MALVFDEIGYWSEIKLDIIEKYALPYSKILSSRRNPEFHHVYIDAFAGSGTHTYIICGCYYGGGVFGRPRKIALGTAVPL